MPVRNSVTGKPVSRAKIERSRELRQEMTEAEELLWQELRGGKLGIHFRRQHILGGYIVDFYCHQSSLVIEVDGDIHKESEQHEYDMARDEALCLLGFRVYRFTNEQVFHQLSNVLSQIKEHIAPPL